MKKCSLLTVLLAFACNAFSQVYQPEHWDGYLSIKVKNDSSHASIAYPQEGVQSPFDSLIAAYGIYSIQHTFMDTTNASLSRCYALFFTDSARMDTLIARLQNYPFLEYVSKSGIGQFYEDSPDDSKYRFQWAMEKILADSVWQLLPGDGKRIKIAVIDDAFLLGHEDLAAAIDTNYNDPIDIFQNDDDANQFNDDFLGWDFGDSDNYVLPPAHVRVKQYSHGTHCAIIAGGVTNNEVGVASFNRGNIKIIPIKNTRDNEYAPANITQRAMEYAKLMGANVISMSFESQNDADSVFMAINPQIIFVVAVGNFEDSSLSNVNRLSLYNLPNLISVGATGIYDEKATFSSYHSTVDVMAPGAGIISGLGTGTDQYGYKNGTSQATPLVAGLCAALWSYDSSLTAQQVIDRVLNTADDISFENRDIKWQIGHGRINAYRAFNNITTQPHQASFKTDKPRSLCQGDTITFIARNYSAVQYVWNFGDGVIDTTADSSTMHICSVTGNFSVSLTLLDSASNDTLAYHMNSEYYGVTSCATLLSDQSQWYFGHYGEVDFRTGRPVAKNNAYLNTTIAADEGSFTVRRV